MTQLELDMTSGTATLTPIAVRSFSKSIVSKFGVGA
jgi:hypothetical protein